jgi:tetratricopeptide (TPR) repeat protein
MRPGWRGPGDVRRRQGKPREAQAVAQGLLADGRLCGEGLVLQGQAAVARGHWAAARGWRKQALEEFLAAPEPPQAWCRFLFDHGDPGGAEAALREQVRWEPKNGAAHSNLGTPKLRLGRPVGGGAPLPAVAASSARACADVCAAGPLLRHAGRVDEARQAWAQALRLDPGNAEAAAGLRG